MKNTKEFINKVTNKIGYTQNNYTVIEDSNVYEDVKEDIENALDTGMVFIEGACLPNSIPNQIVKEYSSSDAHKAITWDKDSGISIIINFKSEPKEGINIQSLGVINSFLNELIKLKSNTLEDNVIEEVQNTEKEPTEHISLKDYYRLNLPNNRIGRKSDKTLIKELEEAGFNVE